MWATVQSQAVTDEETPVADDDTSLYRLFGFSLFVSIRFRKRALFGRLRTRYTYTRRQKYRQQYIILLSLKEQEKSVLPACIKFQDRGKMTFPHHSFLPLARSCSMAIKSHLNSTSFKCHGRYIVHVSSRYYFVYISRLNLCECCFTDNKEKSPE